MMVRQSVALKLVLSCAMVQMDVVQLLTSVAMEPELVHSRLVKAIWNTMVTLSSLC
jgi:hypothetical protein